MSVHCGLARRESTTNANTPLITELERTSTMTKETNTTTAPFLKELDPEFQRFLRLVDRLESEMLRLQVAVADLKVGYYALTDDIKKTVSKL